MIVNIGGKFRAENFFRRKFEKTIDKLQNARYNLHIIENRRVRVVALQVVFQRVADGEIAADKRNVNGLMRAARKRKQVAADGAQPLQCGTYDSTSQSRANLFCQFGWQRRTQSLVPIFIGIRLFFIRSVISMIKLSYFRRKRK